MLNAADLIVIDLRPSANDGYAATVESALGRRGYGYGATIALALRFAREQLGYFAEDGRLYLVGE